MKKKILLSFILMCVSMLVFGVISVSAATSGTYGYLTYEIKNGEVTITDCDSSATKVEIPKKIYGKPVTTIGEYAFWKCYSLTSITIPDSVTSIGKQAFWECYSLTSVTIPDSVTSIGEYAFWECYSLTSITIPDSVTTLGDTAFCDCRSLTSVTIGDSVTTLGTAVFAFCSSLTSVTIPKSVTKIDGLAFNGCDNISTVYYNGTDGEWDEIYIYDGNDVLTNATRVTFKDATYTYDGTEKKLEISGTLPAGAKVEYKNNKATNVGTYNATAKITCTGYDDVELSATLKINPKALTIADLSAQDKVYDGTDKATLSGGTLSGVITGDDVTASIPTEGKFSDKNVGDGKKVTIDDIELNGDDKNNYTLKQPEDLKANITQKEIAVKADDQQMVKNGTMPELTYTVDGLCDGDSFTGTLTTKATGTKTGKFDITQGDLYAGKNYKIKFTKGTLTVSDKKTQSATVSAMPDKTYGDEGFTVSVTEDKNPEIGAFVFESSDKNVAEIDETGNVTIKNAGETNIIVKRAGNDTYADFEKSQKLTVKKVAVTVTAEPQTKKVGTADPELTYTYTGTLVGEDAFTGALKRETGEAVGKYDILQGTLKINDNNYAITYNKATFEILDKTPQTITITGLETKTYGEGTFAISATSTSGLAEFTYASDNTDVATIDEKGTITITGAGKANISVTQAGDDEYAAKTEKKELVVNKKDITVTSVDIANKTAVLDGILEADKETAILDFDKITLTIGDAVDETTSNAVLTNFVLKGDKAANYNVTTESLNTTMANDNVVTVTITAENGTATGAAKYLKNSNVTVVATPNSGYKFKGWYNGDTSVSTSASYTFKAENDVTLVAKFGKKSTGGGGGGSSATTTYNVTFETNDGSKIDSVKVEKNKTVTEPTAPTKDGFEFAGWYTDKKLTTKYDFAEKVTKSFTLYAAWTEKKAEVKDDNKDDTTEPTTPDETKLAFTDVTGNEWFGDNVKYVFENGLMNGVTTTEFAPNGNLTRAMLVAILYRAEGEPETNKGIPFADVKADDYFANAVIWAEQNGIVKGVTETEFAPDENITREQIAAIIYRFANYKGYDTSAAKNTNILSYADYDEISEYAISAMRYAVGSGLIKGKTETTLNPKDNATRAEIAAILQRFIEGNK